VFRNPCGEVSTDADRPMRSSSRIERDFQIPVGSSPTRQLLFRQQLWSQGQKERDLGLE
jgi:hypothetical protein